MARSLDILSFNFTVVLSVVFFDWSFENETAGACEVFANFEPLSIGLNLLFAFVPVHWRFVMANLAFQLKLAVEISFRFLWQLANEGINLVSFYKVDK